MRGLVLRARVVRGEGVGRRLGFPTANLSVPPRRKLPRGVFAVQVRGAALGRDRIGACNVGLRPTVGGRRRCVEVHILGFRGSLYGRALTVTFLGKIRSERKFPSLAALRAQIGRDVRSLRVGPFAPGASGRRGVL